MAKKKTGMVYGILIAFVVISLIIGGLYFILKEPTGQSGIITSQCNLIDEGTASVSYNCPEGFLCRVTPVLNCNQQGQQQIVTGRTDDFDYSSGWLAFNSVGVQGGLSSYTKSTTKSSSQCKAINNLCEEFNEGTTQEIIDLPLGVQGVLCSNGRILTPDTSESYSCNSGNGYTHVVRYNPGSGANINSDTSDCSSTLTTCIGGAAYVCQEDVILIKDSGSQSVVTTLNYAKDDPSPPSTPTTGATYTPSSTPRFESGDTLRFSNIEYERWFCPQQSTMCAASNGDDLEVGDKTCVNSNTLESCNFNQQSGNAEIGTTTTSGQCCLADNECNDNSPLTQDVCVQNSCQNNPIQGACSTSSDCSHPDQTCQNNQCLFPTTGIYCSSAESQSSATRCSGSVLEVCLPVSGTTGAFKWGVSQDCTTIGQVCVE